ncbi:hypothetical protein BDB01DRAFT_782817 [Pilobolus umbonatus]|nr:hypothetical protein BDB01DRAFT_782817 [Pilobolus umbonatus]
MTPLSKDNDDLSSYGEWFISAIDDNVKTSNRNTRATLSPAAIRTIKAHIPSQNKIIAPVPRKQMQIQKLQQYQQQQMDYLNQSRSITVKDTTSKEEKFMADDNRTTITTTACYNKKPIEDTPPIEYISDDELAEMCTNMDASGFIIRLVGVYKNSEVFNRIKDIETGQLSLDNRIKNNLRNCIDPCKFILYTLEALSSYFSENQHNKSLSSKFRRGLCHSICAGLASYLHMPLEQRHPPLEPEEPDLISFNEEAVEDNQTINTSEVNLISFDEELNETSKKEKKKNEEEEGEEEEEEDEEDEEDEEPVITLSQIHKLPSDIISRYTLNRDHQLYLINMMNTVPPIIIYYAMNAFKLHNIISAGNELEEEGVKLVNLLFEHSHFGEASSCIKKLGLYHHFPAIPTAEKLFAKDQGHFLAEIYKSMPELELQLLSFIDNQLSFNYAGELEVVPKEKFANYSNNTSQLLRLKDRRFQRDLVACATKLIEDLGLPAEQNEYFFISLSKQYARLRWILNQRAFQQMEEGDYSLESSSNYNGLLEAICSDNPELIKLCIKELVDMGDEIAAEHFATLYHQQDFYTKYISLPFEDRLLGTVKGEQRSYHRPSPTPKRQPNDAGVAYYVLPPTVQWMMVDTQSSLKRMKDILRRSKLCGLDSEWVPNFAQSGVTKTALMQIASDVGGFIFLLDLKTIFSSENTDLYNLTEDILKSLFEDPNILKLAFDFSGDLSLLHSSMPSSCQWQMSNLLDLKQVRNVKTGGLSGLIQSFLGVSLNKKQRMSNWEKRPLSEEQQIYAGKSILFIQLSIILIIY